MNPQVIAQFIDRLHSAFLEGDPEVRQKQAEAANVRQLQEQYRAIARGDFAAALGYFADDIDMEIIGPPGMPFVGRWQGRDRVGEALRQNFAQLEDQRPEILTVTAQGDTVVLVARERGRFKPTGRPYDIHFVQLFTFRDGRVCRFREFADSAPLSDAAR